MFMPPKSKNKNLGAMFQTTTLKSGAFPAAVPVTEEEKALAEHISLDLLLDNPYQPRMAVNEESLRELAAIIKQQGFQGVLVARPHSSQPGAYQITAGHRRRDAARIAGEESILTVVREISDQDMAILAVTENIQREDLTPLEEGKIFCMMMDTMGMTLENVAQVVGKSESYVRNRRRVALSPEDIQQMVIQRPDSLRAVVYLLKVEDKNQRTPIIDLIVRGELTADQVDHYVKTLGQKGVQMPSLPAHGEAIPLTTIVPPSSPADEKESVGIPRSPEVQKFPVSSATASEGYTRQPAVSPVITSSRLEDHATHLEQSKKESAALAEQSKLAIIQKQLLAYSKRLSQRRAQDKAISREEWQMLLEIAQLVQGLVHSSDQEADNS